MKFLSYGLAGLVFAAGSVSAQTQPGLPSYLSDELVISDPTTGAVYKDFVLPEGVDASGAKLPETAAFNVPGLPDGLQPVGTPIPTALIPNITGVVALLEPLNAVPEGANPHYVQTPYGTRLLSDLVISFNNPNSTQGPGVLFVSDGDGNLGALNSALGGVYQNAFEETGALQDVTPFLKTPYRVQVASDLDVPEPSTVALTLAGLGIMGAGLRRRSSC